MAGRLFGTAGQGNSAPPAIAGFKVQTSVYGLPLPLVYGTARVAGNLIHLQDPKQTPVTTGGSKSKLVKIDPQVTGYLYQAAVALGLCEGPIASIGKVWRDKDSPVAWSVYNAAGWSLFLGTATQAPWTYLSSNHPSEAVPYQLTAYVAHPSLELPNNVLANYGWEVGGLAIFGSLGIVDALPSDIITDFLTNADHGIGFPAAQLASLATYAQYCRAAGLFLSPVVNGQRPGVDTLQEIVDATNSAPVWYDGVLNFIPYADQPITGNGVTYTPNTTPVYDLSDNDFIAPPGTDPISVERKPAIEAFNQFLVEFENRARDYNPDVQEAKDQASIEANGLRPAPSLRLAAIKDASTARYIAELRKQRELNVRNTYTFTLPMRFALLTPMDLVTLTDVGLGFNKLPVRLVSVEESETGDLTMVAEDWPLGTASASRYGAAASAGYTSATNVAPANTAAPVIFEGPGPLTQAGLEIWIAAAGAGANWGGCEVHVSTDNVNFKKVGALIGPSKYGTLRAALANTGAAAYPPADTTNTLQVDIGTTGQLASGAASDLAQATTLCYVDSEFVAFQTATLVSGGQYNLATLARGLFSSTIPASHAGGTSFVRCDQAILRLAYPNGQDGQVVYFKFPAFNPYGNALQDIASVTSYAHTISRNAVTAGQPVRPVPSLSVNATESDETTAVLQLDCAIGTTPASGLSYTLTQKIGRRAPTTIDSGTCTVLPKSVTARRDLRLAIVYTLTVTDPLLPRPISESLTVSAWGKDGAYSSGSGTGRTIEDGARGGTGGVPTRGSAFTGLPVMDATGSIPLIDTVGKQLQTGLSMPGGTPVATTERGGNKADTALDAGSSILGSYVDFTRGFLNKHLGNVPDDATSDRRAATLNQKTGGDRGYTAIDSGGIAVTAAIDFTRSYTNKHLGNVPDDATSDRRAATLNQKTGGDRGYGAIDAGGVAVAAAVDFTRSYTGKHLGNVPDDATTDRRAVTLNQQTGAGRGYSALDTNAYLQTGVTSAALAADGVAGIESTKGSNRRGARNAGHAADRTDEDDTRAGHGGVPTRGSAFTGLPVMTADGVTPLIDTTLGQLQTGLSMPGGTPVATTERGGNKADLGMDGGAQLYQLVQQYDNPSAPTLNKRPLKGYQTGTCKDGDVVTFPVAFQNPPMVVFSRGNYSITNQPDSAQWTTPASYSATKPQCEDVFAASLTATGFTCNAKLRQQGGNTANNQDFPAGNSLTAAGQTAQIALANLPSNNGHYTVRYHPTVTVTSLRTTSRTATLIVVVNKRAGGPTGTVTELRRDSYTSTDPDGTGPYTADYGMMAFDITATFAAGDYLEIAIISLTGTGATGTQSCTVHGAVNAADSVYGESHTYGTSDITTAMTSLTGASVKWEAFSRQ